MRKELYGIAFEGLEQALYKLGYQEVCPGFSGYNLATGRYQGDWRRGPYHILVESRGKGLVLKIHRDVPTGFGHQTIQSSPELRKELRNILQAYKSMRGRP